MMYLDAYVGTERLLRWELNVSSFRHLTFRDRVEEKEKRVNEALKDFRESLLERIDPEAVTIFLTIVNKLEIQ